MALIAMTTADTVDYVSDLDPAKTREKVELPDSTPESPKFDMVEKIGAGATVFKLRGLDVFLKGYIFDNASILRQKQGSDEVGMQTLMNQTNIESVRHGLAGFSNFSDTKGNAIKFDTQKAVVSGRVYDVVSDAVMNTLGIRLVQELGARIRDISEVTGKEEKNSAGA